MEFEEVFKELKKGEEIINNDWNGLKQEGREMFLRLQKPDEHSMNTEPYIVFVSGIYCDKEGNPCKENGGWVFKRFPWTPSVLDLFSNNWRIKPKVEV